MCSMYVKIYRQPDKIESQVSNRESFLLLTGIEEGEKNYSHYYDIQSQLVSSFNTSLMSCNRLSRLSDFCACKNIIKDLNTVHDYVWL